MLSSVSGRLEQTRPDTPAESPPISCFPRMFVILEHANIVVMSISLLMDDIVAEDVARNVLPIIVDIYIDGVESMDVIRVEPICMLE
jgi:hypothetical protein